MRELSFCITCKNRFWQIKKTLPKNLHDNRQHRSKIEFVLIDFGSTDGLSAWIKKEFKAELRSGYLKYFFTEQLVDWHAPIAKNTAHLFATGKNLVNLDCDNFTGENGGIFLLNCFCAYAYPIVIHQFSGHFFDGTFGRIAVSREIFSAIGGYDEQFAPMGFQDVDLLARLVAMGVKYIPIKNKNFCSAIPNSKAESIALCNSNMTYLEMNSSNHNLSLEKLKSRDLIRNSGRYGIAEGIFKLNELRASPRNKPVDYKDLMRKLKLTPLDDLSEILRAAYSIER
jgi:hypothetical protein